MFQRIQANDSNAEQPVLTRISFRENLRWPCNHSQGPFCSEETSYRGTIPISQLHSTRSGRRFHLRRQAQTPRFYVQLRHTSKRSATWSFGLWTSQLGDPEKAVNRRTQSWWSSQKGARRRGRRGRCRCILKKRRRSRHAGKQARFRWPPALSSAQTMQAFRQGPRQNAT